MGRGKYQAFIPVLEVKEVGMCCQPHHRPVVGRGKWQPHTTYSFFFFFNLLEGIHCLKHGFIPQHGCCFAANLTLLKPECDLVVLWGTVLQTQACWCLWETQQARSVCRERHCWMPQSQILSDVKVSNLTGACCCAVLGRNGTSRSRATQPGTAEEMAAWHTPVTWDSRWEQREFTVVAFMSWYMI